MSIIIIKREKKNTNKATYNDSDTNPESVQELGSAQHCKQLPNDVQNFDKNLTLNIATFNLFNYLEPPNAFYDFDRIYSAEQWKKKQKWICDYLIEHQPDIVGFQEVFSPDSLKNLVADCGYHSFAVVDAPEVQNEFIYRSPVVAIASKFPIVEVAAVQPSVTLVESLGLASDFSFSRKVLRATVDVPHLGECDCYVVHLKSKRSLIEADIDMLSAEQAIIESLKSQIAGGWGSTIQRGSEATLLMIDMIERRENTGNPMVLMGDFNNTLTDGVLSHLLTNTLRFVSKFDCDLYLAKYCLQDAWNLFEQAHVNEIKAKTRQHELFRENVNVARQHEKYESIVPRKPTHYFGSCSSVLDYILLSCEFDASHHDSLYQVTGYHTYDRHLINPIFERDGESTDHGIVLVSLTLRS